MITWRELPRSWLLSMFGFVVGYGAHAIWAMGEAVSEWGSGSCPEETTSSEGLRTRAFLGLSAILLSTTLVLTFVVGGNLSRPGKVITGLTACLDAVMTGMLCWGLYVYVTAACKLPVLFVTVAFWAGHLFLSIAVASGWAALLRRIFRRRKRREQRRRERGARMAMSGGPGPQSGSLVRKQQHPLAPSAGHHRNAGSASALFHHHHHAGMGVSGPGNGIGQPSLNNWVHGSGLASPGTGRSRGGVMSQSGVAGGPASSPPLRFMHPHLALLHQHHAPPSASSAAATPPTFAILSGTESARGTGGGGGGGGGASVPGRPNYLAPPSPNVYSPR